MIYLVHDIHEKLDYAFTVDTYDKLSTVNLYQQESGTINVISCNITSADLTDSEGNIYPAGSAIIMWIEGGVADTIEAFRLEYTTEGGRRLDEKITFRVVEED